MVDSLEHSKTDDTLAGHLVQLRNKERVELIMSFYRGLKVFRDLSRRSHAVSLRFHHDDLDRLIEVHLRQVKDSCHRLFRESKRREADRLLQAIFDMYFGILFHILQKAKENLRLRENYNIQRLDGLVSGLRTTGEMADLPRGVGQLFDRLTKEFERDSEELQGEMARARFMFSQLEKIFNRIIEVYDDNPTIIRSLYCQRDFFAELFPGEGIDRLFAQIYRKNGPVEAYFLLGFDFLRSGHTAQAYEAFTQVIKTARQRRTPLRRLRRLYNRYRERTLADLSRAGNSELRFQVRLREIEDRPPLRALLTDQTGSRATSDHT
ncbi:hypothetical protein AMJ85_11740 [candidate division BRC1 bacterium SM23_51]|nr:MAG: hypothetical protein AMJ85_11740 [candidate division BRC1 bacterium SM23_51]